MLSTVASDRDPDELEALRARTRAKYEDEGHPYHSSARLWDDGVIEPGVTRDVVGLALSVCANAPLGPDRAPCLSHVRPPTGGARPTNARPALRR